jgi:uncharacterized protein (TIGR00369 family)
MHEKHTLTEFMENEIPFNRLLGMKVDHMAAGEVILRIPSRPELIGDPFRPALHGGVTSALADTAGGLAVFTRIQRDQTTSTVDLRVDYLRPGETTMDLLAKSTVIRLGNRVAAAQTVVYQDDIDNPVAVATGVYNVIAVNELRPHISTESDA